MPILNSVISSLDALGSELCELDMSQPRYNLSSLGVHHTFEADTQPSYKVRNAYPHEAKLVAPGTKGVYEDMLVRIGVQHANLGKDQELDSQAFEDFYDKTVDLADLCQLPEVNERLNQVANQYQEYSLRKEELGTELKRLAVIPRMRQRLSKLPQMRAELAEAREQKEQMQEETLQLRATVEGMEKDIAYLRMEHAMEQESEGQALQHLDERKRELERLRVELENKRRLLQSRREAYRKRRPLTAVEHAERMLSDLRSSVPTENIEELQPRRDALVRRLNEMVSNSEATELANRFVDKVFAATIDNVANEDPGSLEARRQSRRLSVAASTPSGRIMAAQLLCVLYSRHVNGLGGVAEDELRAELADFARERQWNPELVVQAMYEVFGKKLAKRYRENRTTHYVRLLWD
ncbi:hypothetical protein GGI07_003644 [Coemansia sp. Benny D115]|nr:hypothetical protein GGI07_003644 [Coemansia sp. Benny D115]